VRLYIVIIVLTFFAYGCILKADKEQPRTFYNTISGWDITYIPIIEPYRATSLDKGFTWSINRPEVVNSFEVKRFGVSQDLIYGQGYSKWFLLDTKSKLYAEYPTKEELINSLSTFSVPINDIDNCNSYFDSLANGKDLYWFPKDGKKYPTYPSITPDEVTLINVSEKNDENPDFWFSKDLSKKKSKVYYFKVKYNKSTNKLYYLSFDNSPPVLVKDNLLVPVFSDNNEFDITLFTPYQVAQDNGISEERRFLKSKTVYIR
jgi:hypothetical protein